MKRLQAKIIKNGPLSQKECVVLRLLCEGYYRPEIALKLNRTIHTVSSHVEHIAQKLGAHGSTEIVLMAEKMGLVEIRLTQPAPFYPLFIVFLMSAQLFSSEPKRRPPQSPRPAVRLLRRELNS